jgi:two-component system chemotaxis response regulator CheY
MSTFKVLTVDDEPFIGAALKRILERSCGCLCTHARDGKDGLAQGQTGNFHLIISDINMPYMNGVEMVKGLRQAGITTPIIMVSAPKDDGLYNEATQMLQQRVIQGLVQKPWINQVLQDLVRAHSPAPENEP